MLRSFSSLLSIGEGTLNTKLDEFCSLGFTREEALKIFKAFPSVLGHTKEYIVNRIDITSKLGYKKDNMYIKCNDTYEHTIKLPDNMLPFSSEKHTKKYVKPQNLIE